MFCAGSLLLPIRRFTPAMWPAHIGVRWSRTYEVGLKWMWDSWGTCHFSLNISLHSFQEKTQNEFQKGVWHRGTWCLLMDFIISHMVCSKYEKLCNYTFRYRRGDEVLDKKVWFTINVFNIAFLILCSWYGSVNMTILCKQKIKYTPSTGDKFVTGTLNIR